jgi:hypothetical protein
MDVFADFVADVAEELIVDEVLNYGVLVAEAIIRMLFLKRDGGMHTVAMLRSSPCSRRAPCYRISRCGNSCAPHRRRWLSSSSPGRWEAPGSSASPFYVSSVRNRCQVRGRGGRNGFVEL